MSKQHLEHTEKTMARRHRHTHTHIIHVNGSMLSFSPRKLVTGRLVTIFLLSAHVHQHISALYGPSSCVSLAIKLYPRKQQPKQGPVIQVVSSHPTFVAVEVLHSSAETLRIYTHSTSLYIIYRNHFYISLTVRICKIKK